VFICLLVSVCTHTHTYTHSHELLHTHTRTHKPIHISSLCINGAKFDYQRVVHSTVFEELLFVVVLVSVLVLVLV